MKRIYLSGPMTGSHRVDASNRNQVSRQVRINCWDHSRSLLLRKPLPGQFHIKAPTVGMY